MNKYKNKQCEAEDFAMLDKECTNKVATYNFGMYLCRKHNEMVVDWVNAQRPSKRNKAYE